MRKCTLRRWRTSGKRRSCSSVLVGSGMRRGGGRQTQSTSVTDSPVCCVRRGGYVRTTHGLCWVCGVEEASLVRSLRPRTWLPGRAERPLARGASCPLPPVEGGVGDIVLSPKQ